ncbi:2'-5' RNA ligase family protein [Mycolicibacterium palauense]|uniref:2'-5' RNA ligase family protein n=1 Tax=Mycolicibacterium palauense TaxID=2034511 RepID=UPI000BFEE2D3|nr:2'-5' RNA ligase family protein [Mycolicibacterium palauense]
MVHSVELLFDERTEAQVRRMWSALDDAGLPSQARHRSASNRPHVTVMVAERLGAAVDEELAALPDLADALPLECTVGAPLVFGGGRLVLARLIVPTEALLALQRRVFEVCAPHLHEVLPHAGPGHWTPHVTLGRRIRSTDLPAALEALAELRGDLTGRFSGLRRWDGDARVEHRLVGP